MSSNPCRYAAYLMAAFLLLGCDNTKCQRCTDSGPAHDTRDGSIHIYNSTFAFQFTPPWFNADQRSLLTSYVVFPEEAKLNEWVEWVNRPEKNCSGEEDTPAPASICPEREFYKKAMEPFLTGLSHCATEKPVELLTMGFASSTKAEVENHTVKEHYNRYVEAIDKGQTACRGERDTKEASPSNMFNLLIANQRADNVTAMLKGFLSEEKKKMFDIKCNYVKFETGRNLPPILKIVTHPVHATLT